MPLTIKKIHQRKDAAPLGRAQLDFGIGFVVHKTAILSSNCLVFIIVI